MRHRPPAPGVGAGGGLGGSRYLEVAVGSGALGVLRSRLLAESGVDEAGEGAHG